MSKKITDKGPWRPGVTADGRRFIESDDFTHDVRLYVDGDFASVDDKSDYANGIAQQLNASPVSAEPVGWLGVEAGNILVARRSKWINGCPDRLIALGGRTDDFILNTYVTPDDIADFEIMTAPVAAQPDITQQTLDDVKAGIPARDAEIEALRKELETLQAQMKNSVVVHSNMCRGIIAPITFDMLAHVLGDEAKQEWLAAQAHQVDKPTETQGKLVDKSPDLQGQQPVCGADSTQEHGLSLVNAKNLAAFPAVDAALATFFNEGTSDNAAALVLAVMTTQAQLSGNTGQLDHLPDATKMVAADQFRDAAQMIEPSGNSGKLPDAARVPLDSLHADAEYLLSRVKQGSLSVNEAAQSIRSRIEIASAALAQQDTTLQAEVLSMVQMLEANEWADHCGKSELGQRLEWAITALQNRIAELTISSSQQDADKVDAWQCTTTLTESDDLIWLYCQDTNTIDGPVASSPEFIDSWTHWAWVKHPSTATIGAARKEPDQ